MTSTIVTAVPTVEHDEHYRTTIQGPEVTSEVFIEIKASWQVAHQHHFSDLSRFGDAVCHGCGATAWSEAWVADGVFGEATHRWADDRYRGYFARLGDDAKQVRALQELVAKRNSVTLMAPIDADEPALVNKRDRMRQEPVFPSM